MRHSGGPRRLIGWLAVSILAAVIGGCGDGDDGQDGEAGPPGPAINPTFSATSIAIDIQDVTINSAPVVRFRAVDENDLEFVGLKPADLRFNIAKLVPGANGDPSVWQSYINQERDGAMRAAQERTRDGNFGILVDHGDGSYTYTFKTDLQDAAADCPLPCEDAQRGTRHSRHGAARGCVRLLQTDVVRWWRTGA